VGSLRARVCTVGSLQASEGQHWIERSRGVPLDPQRGASTASSDPPHALYTRRVPPIAPHLQCTSELVGLKGFRGVGRALRDRIGEKGSVQRD